MKNLNDFANKVNEYFTALRILNFYDYDRITNIIRRYVYDNRTKEDFTGKFYLTLMEQVGEAVRILDNPAYPFFRWVGDEKNEFEANQFLKMYHHLEFEDIIAIKEGQKSFSFKMTEGETFHKKFLNEAINKHIRHIDNVYISDMPEHYTGSALVRFYSTDSTKVFPFNEGQIDLYEYNKFEISWVEVTLTPDPNIKPTKELIFNVVFGFNE
jgi:hypothetical protein